MAKRQKRGHSDIRKIAFGAVFAALACVLLLVGGVLELLDMTSAAVASAVVLITSVLFGKSTGFSVYAVSAVLTLILMPTATSTIYYGILLGWYPIFKIFLETKIAKRLPRLLLKLAAFNLGAGGVLLLFVKLRAFGRACGVFDPRRVDAAFRRRIFRLVKRISSGLRPPSDLRGVFHREICAAEINAR